MKKIIALLLCLILCILLCACGEANTEKTSNQSSSNYSYSSSNNSNSTKTCIECGKSATRTYTNPFSYELENYCQTHYEEIIDMMSGMEEDVGGSKYSTHKCEECSKEGTHRYEGFTGQTEYYCTEHYEELMDLLNAFGLE